MAMTAKLWSINALAVELNMDRRTVGARLRGVRPDGRLNGNPAWHLTTALEALRPTRPPHPSAAPEPPAASPPYVRFIDDLPTDLERGYALAHVWSVYHAPALGAWAVTACGGRMDLAVRVAQALTIMLVSEGSKFGRQMGLEPWKLTKEPALYCRATFPEVDWRRLRVEAGEPDWRPPHPALGFEEDTVSDAPPAAEG